MKRFDIILHEPSLSKDGIERHKDFAALMAKHQRIKNKSYTYKTITGGAAFLLAIAALWFVFQNNLTQDDRVAGQQLREPQQIETTLPAEEKPEGSTSSRNVRKQEEPPQQQVTGQEDGDTEQVSAREQERPIREEERQEEQPGNNPKPVYKEEKVVETRQKLIYTEATPSGGLENLQEYFNDHLVYPEEELSAGKEGTVIVSFVINTEGEADEIRIVHAVSAGIDHEAIRLIREMPAWEPAHVNGEPVISRVNIPVTFNLSDYEKF